MIKNKHANTQKYSPYYSKIIRTLLIFISMLVVGGCVGCSGSSSSSKAAPEVRNSVPLANAGENQLVLLNTLVTLNGANSSDEQNAPLSFHWVLVDIPLTSQAILSNSAVSKPTFMADVIGGYLIALVVNDGELDSAEDRVLIQVTSENVAPVANAGPDQSALTGGVIKLDGNNSSDANDDTLTYFWEFVLKPENSLSELMDEREANSSFIADVDGNYVVALTVHDGTLSSNVDAIEVISTSSTASNIDTFDGNSPLLTTINNENSLPDISKNNGRYRANLVNNSNNITLHFNSDQGRLDAALVEFPFEFIARNIGVGMQSDSQTAPPHVDNPFNFTGVQVHVLDLDEASSSHVVVGHRGGTGFTVEGKNTVNGVSIVNDIGANRVPAARADIRIVGNEDRTLTIYWQVPNLAMGVQSDEWQLYGENGGSNADGRLPGIAPNYGSSVYVGLITYAYWGTGVPFVGTCDSVEIK